MDPDEIQSPKADLGYPWVIIYEHRAIVCSYVYDFSLNKQTNKQTNLVINLATLDDWCNDEEEAGLNNISPESHHECLVQKIISDYKRIINTESV